MFQTKYSVSPKLLSNIKRIAVLLNEFEHKKFADVVLMEFEKAAE